jgi:hypothetical protein
MSYVDDAIQPLYGVNTQVRLHIQAGPAVAEIEKRCAVHGLWVQKSGKDLVVMHIAGPFDALSMFAHLHKDYVVK